MAIQLSNGRPMPKKRVTVPYQANGLDTGFNEASRLGGGIQPGSHPELEKPTGFGNPFTQIGDLYKRLTKKKAVK